MPSYTTILQKEMEERGQSLSYLSIQKNVYYN